MSQVSLVIQETGVPQVFLALEIQDLVEREVSRVSQEDRDLLVHQVKKSFYVYPYIYIDRYSMRAIVMKYKLVIHNIIYKIP